MVYHVTVSLPSILPSGRSQNTKASKLPMEENAETTVHTLDASLLTELIKSANNPSATTLIRFTDNPEEITTCLAIILIKNFPNPLFRKKFTILVIISTALPVCVARYVFENVQSCIKKLYNI